MRATAAGLTHRGRALVAACALLVGLLVGCGAPPGESGGSAASVPGYPISIQGYLGTAVIPAPPRRVVALANGDADAAIALGVEPLAIARDTSAPDGLYPWLAGRIDPARVTLLDSSQGVPVEQVAALRPDVILATNALKIDDVYPQLSAIAPTVTRPTRLFTADWQGTTTAIGRALGREAEVPKVIGAVNNRIAQERARWPNLAGRTASVTWVAGPGTIRVIKDPNDVVTRFLGELGLSLPSALVGSGPGEVSPEQIGLLNADLVIVTYSTPRLRQSFESTELFRRLPAVASGHYLPIDMSTMTQLRSPTTAGIPWLLDRLDAGLATVGR